MGYVIKILKFADYSSFYSVWEKDGCKSFACVWDTDKIDFNIEDLKGIINLGCIVFISIGQLADKLHDTVDSIAESIQLDTNPEFQLDTRGNSNSNDTVADAIFELENCLFEETKGSFNNVYIFTDKRTRGQA